MGTFVAKLKNGVNWVKLIDQVYMDEYTSIDLRDAMVYDPSNDMAHQWFKFQDFSTKPSFMQFMQDDFDVVELEDLKRPQYTDIEFFAFIENHRIYMQKVSKSSFLKKKWFSWDGQILKYQTKDDVVYVNPVPNCIYDKETDELFFMEINKAYAIFGDIKEDYKTATDAEVGTFLSSDIVFADGFDVANVGIANRKRITAVLQSYNALSQQDKKTLKNYIHEKLGNNELVFSEETQKFKVSSDKELRLLLYGIQRRYYSPLFEAEVQVATNSTSISKIL